MNSVRIGIVGMGGIGGVHARCILEGKAPGGTLAAVCDPIAQNLERFAPARVFTSFPEMLDSGTVDAVLIATPHYAHTALGILALERGFHVLVEKPISVHKADCERLLAAHKDPKQVFAAMFNQRTDPHYIRIRNLIRSGELGEIRRIAWTITNWFRAQAYYNSGGWRATWEGEGGGVLLNQCPHNIDLFQWLFGMPSRVRALCALGRYHDIEVEDDVTATFEYPNGTTAVFIASTGEAPGTNRLEIAAERGRLVLDEGEIRWLRNEIPAGEFSRTSPNGFDCPPAWQVQIPVNGNGEQHAGIIKNFVEAIRDGVPLIAPAAEGIHSVELANAMLLASHLDRPVDLPMDSAVYAKLLQERIAASTFKKKTEAARAPVDLSGSFNRV